MVCIFRMEVRQVDGEGRRASMQLTPTITFRGIEPSAALEAKIRTRIDKLETYSPSIMGCHVLMELAQRHHEAGNRYHVRIDLTVPGEEIVVAHEASLHGTDSHGPQSLLHTLPCCRRRGHPDTHGVFPDHPQAQPSQSAKPIAAARSQTEMHRAHAHQSISART
jgi:Sigma 54 modulation protein / S30EA ribosomal protein